MNEFNSSNAYKLRYDSDAARKQKKTGEAGGQKRIRPNMTVRLNRMDGKKSRHKHMLAAKPMVNPFRSFNPAEVRALVAFGLAFSMLIAFLVVNVKFQMRDNELTHRINLKKKELSSLMDDHTTLIVKKKSLMNDSAIQEYAEQNLGMQKMENYQLVYFKVPWEDDFAD